MHSKFFPGAWSEVAGVTHCSRNRYTKFRSEVHTKRRKGVRPQRTSTPVNDSEEKSECADTSEGCTASVDDFFYQSWKSELNSEWYEQSQRVHQPPTTGNIVQNFNYYIVNNNYHPVWYLNHAGLLNNFSPHFVPYTASVIYYQAVGYREDGTYGVLPGFWFYYCR